MLDEDAKWFAVSLRLVGDGFDPISVEDQLGLKPDLLCLKGRPRIGKSGREYGLCGTNIWSYRVTDSLEIGFDDQIRMLFESLGNGVDRLRSLGQTDGVHAELFCGFGSGNGQGGDVIQAATLKLLVDAGLHLSLDLYPPDVDDESVDYPPPP